MIDKLAFTNKKEKKMLIREVGYLNTIVLERVDYLAV